MYVFVVLCLGVSEANYICLGDIFVIGLSYGIVLGGVGCDLVGCCLGA